MLGIRFKSVLSLKAYILIFFAIAWNAGFLTGRYLGGGGVKGSFEPIALETHGVVGGAACLFFLCAANPRIAQKYFIAPSRSQNYRPREFYLLAFVTGGLTVSYFLI